MKGGRGGNDLYLSCICIHTSLMLRIVDERESVHAKLEARTTLRYVQCLSHINIQKKTPVQITRRARYPIMYTSVYYKGMKHAE